MLFVILSGFLGAAIAPLLKRLFGHYAGLVLALIPAAIFVYLWQFTADVAAGITFRESQPWVPELGVEASFFIDGLSLVFALLISGIGVLIMIYAGGYLKGHKDQGRFLSFLLMFMASMLGLVLADHFITFFIFWELTSVTSFLLIGFDHTRRASRRAAVQALVVTGGGGLALLAGLLLLGGATGIYQLSTLQNIPPFSPEAWFLTPVIILILVGAFTKSAQFPFHFWLPNAMEAPTPVSAYLHSATMVKGGVYLIARVNPAFLQSALWHDLLIGFGLISLIIGTLLALRQRDMKLILAYTTVASLGLMIMLIGIGTIDSWQAAALYLVAHALFKGALFMAVGAIEHQTGSRDILQVGGLLKSMPVTAAAVILAGLSMAGVVPFFGFSAKETIYAALVEGGAINFLVLAGTILGNALMFVASVILIVRPFFGNSPAAAASKPPHEAGWMLWLGPLSLALLGLMAGLGITGIGDYLITPVVYSIAARLVPMEFHFWHGFNAPLFLSLATIALGLGLFLIWDIIRTRLDKILSALNWGPDKAYDQFLDGVVGISRGIIRILQSGQLHIYTITVFAVITAGLFYGLIVFDALPHWPQIPNLPVYEWAAVAMGVLGCLIILSAKTRLAAILAMGVVGYSVGLIFLLYGAPDLTFTQFMIETLSVVILALVLTRLRLEVIDPRAPVARLRDGAIALGLGAGISLLLLAVTQGTFDMQLTNFFAAYSQPVAHGRNIVNVILVDFRALDTLGEISVILIAGLSVLGLIRLRKSPRKPSQETEETS